MFLVDHRHRKICFNEEFHRIIICVPPGTTATNKEFIDEVQNLVPGEFSNCLHWVFFYLYSTIYDYLAAIISDNFEDILSRHSLLSNKSENKLLILEDLIGQINKSSEFLDFMLMKSHHYSVSIVGKI
jgi:hypothetical protein